MEVKFLDLHKNYDLIKDEVNKEIQKVLDNNDYILGNNVKLFENNFAKYLGVKYFSGVGNGTDALEIAIKCLDLNPTDEVIVQNNTYIATCLGVVSNNHNLVLCECDRNTFQIDINDLKCKINKNTRAIIVVPLYGLVPDMDKICDICDKNNIILIEDAAQAHGAEWKGTKIGSFGLMSCFSFYPGKNLGAYGDAGGIATNNEELNIKIKKIKNNGSIIKYEHEILGRNSRLDTIQASILNVKLKYLDENNEKRRQNVIKYRKLLNNIKEIELPIELEHSKPVYHLFVIKTKYRNELQDYLKKHNIITLIHYPISCSELECFNHLNINKTSSKLSNEILSLPMYPELTTIEIEYTCSIIKKMFIEREQSIIKFKSICTKKKNGILHFLNELNFNTKRIFYIDNFQNDNDNRGKHANKNCDEYLIIINGDLKIELINNKNERKKFYLFKDEGIFIKRHIWINFNSTNKDTILLVIANEEYNKTESVFNFDDFLV